MKKIWVNALFALAFALPVIAEVEESPELSEIKTRQEHSLSSVEAPEIGTILTDGKGRTLYRYAGPFPDTMQEEASGFWSAYSIIDGKPALAPGLPGKGDVVKRYDDSLQVTYNDWPLYYFVKDSKPGDHYGNKVEAAWFVINTSKK